MFEQLAALADRLEQVRDQILTEEATKTALILPFLRELGYDIFNPAEVVPEFTADVGIKKGEKVDYAIFQDGKPIILIESKPLGARLDSYSSQLYRYFSVTNARIAVLTDGAEYRFFSDLAEPNRLDLTPFFTCSLERLRKEDAERVAQFSKKRFNLGEVLADAENLKLRAAMRAHLAREFATPSDSFVRHFAESLHEGRFTQPVLEKYRVILRSAFADFLAEAVDRRLQSAIQARRTEAGPVSSSPNMTIAEANQPPQNSSEQTEPEIVTTMEELHGFYSIRTMLRDLVDPRRIHPRDVQSYFGILLDDNNRKPICRLWFNRSQRYLGVFSADKREERIPLADVDDLFNHADRIRESLKHVLGE